MTRMDLRDGVKVQAAACVTLTGVRILGNATESARDLQGMKWTQSNARKKCCSDLKFAWEVDVL